MLDVGKSGDRYPSLTPRFHVSVKQDHPELQVAEMGIILTLVNNKMDYLRGFLGFEVWLVVGHKRVSLGAILRAPGQTLSSGEFTAHRGIPR